MVKRGSFEGYLVEKGLLTPEQVERSSEETRRTGVSLEQAIVSLGFVPQENLYRALADFAGLAYVDLSTYPIDKSVIEGVPARFVTHYNFMPVEERDGLLRVAVCDPQNTHLLDELHLVLKRRVEPVVSSPAEIAKATTQYYGIGAETVERILSEADAEERTVVLDEHPAENIDDASLDASMIKFVNQIVVEAIHSGATDIHIEPFERQLRVRYRIDGVLHQASIPQTVREFHTSIVSRVKIMADLDIAEKRLPQDGKIRVNLGADEYDLRVSILPTPHGETVNIRILSRSSMFLSLEKLGFAGLDLVLFEKLIDRPHGIILVTGPTGSGKTTTLYASLNKLNSVDKKIITIEDPIEYQLAGVTQMQVLPKIGFDFARGLRSMLRHDPDIMLVGEIRDYETAEAAIRSALTGHLVFSTLHTNDAAGAITRLIDMGVEPFLLSSTIIACIAQRLVRLICNDCKVPYEPDDEEFRSVGADPAEWRDKKFYRGTGCEKCRHTGYKGRLAIFEMMPFWSEIKSLTVTRAPTNVVKDKARALGMRTLLEDGWERIVEGITTFEEVLKVAKGAEFALEPERSAVGRTAAKEDVKQEQAQVET
jgi:type II secretion system protein E